MRDIEKPLPNGNNANNKTKGNYEINHRERKNAVNSGT
jgi:hypothetical protein